MLSVANTNNCSLTGNKVTLFSREKPEIFYYSSDSETNNSSRVLRGKNVTFYQLIRNFLSILLVYLHGTIFKDDRQLQYFLQYFINSFHFWICLKAIISKEIYRLVQRIYRLVQLEFRVKTCYFAIFQMSQHILLHHLKINYTFKNTGNKRKNHAFIYTKRMINYNLQI